MMDLDVRVPACRAAELLGMSPQLFNHHRRSGRFTPVNGAYRLGDLVDAEVTIRRRQPRPGA